MRPFVRLPTRFPTRPLKGRHTGAQRFNAPPITHPARRNP